MSRPWVKALNSNLTSNMGQTVPEPNLEIHFRFLLSWLKSPKSSSSLTTKQLPEIEGFTAETIDWLHREGFVSKVSRRRGLFVSPGRKREKVLTAQEVKRAEKALKNRSRLKPSTIRFYESILGRSCASDAYKITLNSLPIMLESIYGVPDRVTATEFAILHDLPTTVIKAWFRDLIETDKAEVIVVRGRRLLIPRRRPRH